MDGERALLFGAVAGAFAIVPDVDIGYAVVGIATADPAGLESFPDVFWETGNIVHRGLTHSLAVGSIAAVLFGLAARRDSLRLAAVAGLAGGVVLTFLQFGTLEAGVIASFSVAGLLVVAGARRFDLEPRTVFAAALLGLLTHPFGDVFTGTSPTLLAPIDVQLLPKRVSLSSDATLHLLGAFGIELAVVWMAVLVYLLVHNPPVRAHVDRRAVLGVGYASMVFVLPPPTLAVSYQFVFSVLATGIVVAALDLPRPDIRSSDVQHSLAVTGLATVTIAWLAYTAGYLLV
jgi:membrane-bound metal-dependent hydrolase YbcI (DUF457 family)